MYCSYVQIVIHIGCAIYSKNFTIMTVILKIAQQLMLYLNGLMKGHFIVLLNTYMYLITSYGSIYTYIIIAPQIVTNEAIS